MTDIVYDAVALIAAQRNDRAMWADHRARLEQGVIPVAPAPVVAQVSRSPRQAQLRRLLRGCDVTALDEDIAHRVGHLLARADTADVIDGAVIAEALARSAAVVPSDRDDLAHIVGALSARVPIIDV